MRCNYCQSEFDDNLVNCPVCGAPVPPAEDKKPDYFSGNQAAPVTTGVPVPPEFAAPAVNPLHAKTDALVKDNLFLAVCILQTVRTALPLFGLSKNISVIGIIIAVFLWIIYAESKKGLPDPSRIRIVSGCVYAAKIVLYVVGGLIALMGILCFFSASYWVGLFTDAFSGKAEITSNLDRFFSMGGWIAGVIFLIAAALIIILNYFSYGKIHRFVKSCYTNIQSGKDALENRSSSCVWFIVFAVFQGLAALGSITSSPLSSVIFGCSCAVCIISYMLIKKYYYEYN